MSSRIGWFDGDALYGALDAVRQARNLTWKQVAAESGVSASTLTRMAQGRRPDLDSLASLSAWSGLQTDDFVRFEGERPETELGSLGDDLHLPSLGSKPDSEGSNRSRWRNPGRI